MVTGADGDPRVLITATADRGAIEIVSRARAMDVISSVEIFATDRSRSEPAHVGVALVERGDIVAIFDATDDAPPELWLGDADSA